MLLYKHLCVHHLAKGGGAMASVLEEETLTVPEAAELLKVSTSTLWRWIDRGDLPAYRIGRRRVRVRKSDLEDRLISARGSHAAQGTTIYTSLADVPRRLTPEEQARGLAAVQRLRDLQAQMLRERGGELFPSSSVLINEMRDERTRQLS